MSLGSLFKKHGGGIAGNALGLGAGIFGGIQASKAMRDIKNNIKGQMRENQDWYDRAYNEDFTQRADAQRLLTETEERIRQRNRAAQGAAAVGGASPVAAAAQAAANSAEMADVTSNIAAQASSRKDNIESQYMANKAVLNDQLNGLSREKAQAITDAARGVAEKGGNIAKLI